MSNTIQALAQRVTTIHVNEQFHRLFLCVVEPQMFCQKTYTMLKLNANDNRQPKYCAVYSVHLLILASKYPHKRDERKRTSDASTSGRLFYYGIFYCPAVV